MRYRPRVEWFQRQKLLTKTLYPLREIPGGAHAYVFSRPWMETTRCNRYHGLAEEQRELVY